MGEGSLTTGLGVNFSIDIVQLEYLTLTYGSGELKIPSPEVSSLVLISAQNYINT